MSRKGEGRLLSDGPVERRATKRGCARLGLLVIIGARSRGVIICEVASARIDGVTACNADDSK